MIRSGPTVVCRRLRNGLLLSGIALLAGCGLLPGTDTTTIKVFADNRQLEQWQLNGKIGVRSEQSAHSAYIRWRQCGRQFDIQLSGPLGQGAARLYGDDQQVTLDQGKGPDSVITAGDPNQLLATQLDWPLPVRELLHWVRGLPAPGQRFQPQPLGFRQSGWSLSYPRQLSTPPFTLPAKTVAKRPELTVTLISRQWQLQPDCP